MGKLRCPKCGNTVTFYIKERYTGTCEMNFRTDNIEPDNTNLYSNTSHKVSSKFVYCRECNSKVTTIDSILWKQSNYFQITGGRNSKAIHVK